MQNSTVVGMMGHHRDEPFQAYPSRDLTPSVTSWVYIKGYILA